MGDLTQTNHGSAIPLPATEPLLEPDETHRTRIGGKRQYVYYACRLNRETHPDIITLVTPDRLTRSELNALYDKIVAAWS
jgi:hypothetical protein